MVRSCKGDEMNHPHDLGEVFDFAFGHERLWRPEELGAVLEHELAAPVQFELTQLDPRIARKLRTVCAAEGLLVKSFNDLLHHPQPPVELLELTKEYAKACIRQPESPLPEDVAKVLYYGSIIVARNRCGRRISTLKDEELDKAVRWVLAQPWLDESTRSVFEEGVNGLQAPAE